MEPEKNNFTSPFENRPSVQEAKSAAKKKSLILITAVIIAAIISLVVIISYTSKGKNERNAAVEPAQVTAVTEEKAVVQESEKAVEVTEEPAPAAPAAPVEDAKTQKKASVPLFFLACECIELPFLDGELMAAAKLSINPDSTNTNNVDVDFVTLPGTKQEKHKLSRIGMNWKDDEVFLMTPPVKAGGQTDSVIAEIRIYTVKGRKPAVFKIKRASLIPFEDASSELQLFALSAADKDTISNPAKKQKMIECINSIKGIDKSMKQAMIESLDSDVSSTESTADSAAEAE